MRLPRGKSYNRIPRSSDTRATSSQVETSSQFPMLGLISHYYNCLRIPRRTSNQKGPRRQCVRVVALRHVGNCIHQYNRSTHSPETVMQFHDWLQFYIWDNFPIYNTRRLMGDGARIVSPDVYLLLERRARECGYSLGSTTMKEPEPPGARCES
jgi:hypothetical protein